MIKVLKAGMMSTIQDLGRPEGGAYGVPYGGAMDRNSLRLANSFVNNPLNAACIETTIVAPELLFNTSCLIAVTGAENTPKINGEPTLLNCPLQMKKGDVLSFENRVKHGVRNYISFQGGVDVPLVMGSQSTYLEASLGGYKGRVLQANDEIELLPFNDFFQIDNLLKTPLEKRSLKIHPGPEFHMLTPSEISRLLSKLLTISNDSNRMGYRFQESILETRKMKGIVSSGIIRGTVQLPNSGKPIIMMADAPTTGGYPRIAVLDEVEVDALAQLKAGMQIQLSF